MVSLKANVIKNSEWSKKKSPTKMFSLLNNRRSRSSKKILMLKRKTKKFRIKRPSRPEKTLSNKIPKTR